MDKPKICAKKSKTLNLHPGTYYYCRCGLSTDQPFCDGKHEGTSYEPKRFKISEPQTVGFCMCKYSESSPYCDGSHRKLPDE